jgi:ABC-type bacteriocin/lantibiotic exporter with double-glycine peptidase domain
LTDKLIEFESRVHAKPYFLNTKITVLVEHGQLLEIGSHEELLAKKGKYAELFRLQAKGYL